MEIALTIAGSDSGGGAGIQADLKTFHQFGVFGTSVITAVTAQNTLGVSAWEGVTASLVRKQLEAVLSDLHPSAFKSGMLPDASIVSELSDAIRSHGLTNYVLDPVMVATSGDVLIRNDALSAIRDKLFPLAMLATPNLDEAAALLGAGIATESDMVRSAELLQKNLGAGAVLLKGGHLAEGGEVIDVFFDGECAVFRHPRIASRSTHGTGCTLSAAIAAQLARGVSLREAVASAIDFVQRAIAAAPGVGRGHGPLNHFVNPEAKRTP